MKSTKMDIIEDINRPVTNYLVQCQNMYLDWKVEVLYYGLLKDYAIFKGSVKTRVPFKTCSIGKRRLRRIKVYLRKQAKIKTLDISAYRCKDNTIEFNGVEVIFKYDMLKVI